MGSGKWKDLASSLNYICLSFSFSLSDAGTEECSGFSPGFSSHSPSPSQDSLSSQSRMEGHMRHTHSEENTHRVATSSSQVCVCVREREREREREYTTTVCILSLKHTHTHTHTHTNTHTHTGSTGAGPASHSPRALTPEPHWLSLSLLLPLSSRPPSGERPPHCRPLQERVSHPQCLQTAQGDAVWSTQVRGLSAEAAGGQESSQQLGEETRALGSCLRL